MHSTNPMVKTMTTTITNRQVAQNRNVSLMLVAVFGLTAVLLAFFASPQTTLAQSSDKNESPAFDHSVFQKILEANVDADGWVDYTAIKADVASLDTYLDGIKKADISALDSNEQLAFLINSYNAFTLKLIVENYPLNSINDIAANDRWDAVRWNLGGRIVSLNQLEHELIRPNFAEPRIHFALVCAAIGCPPLRQEVFTGKDLESQLADQTTYVHNHGTWFAHNKSANSVQLTKLYSWYGDDFVKSSGSVLKFISENSTQLEGVTNPSVSWLEYDWTLNDTKKKTTR